MLASVLLLVKEKKNEDLKYCPKNLFSQVICLPLAEMVHILINPLSTGKKINVFICLITFLPVNLLITVKKLNKILLQ